MLIDNNIKVYCSKCNQLMKITTKIRSKLKHNQSRFICIDCYKSSLHTGDFGFFHNIDTEHKAYWLGYIMADGCIYKNRLAITSKDVDHLKNFKFDLNTTNDIKIYKQRYGYYGLIRISSLEIVNDLSQYGIIPNKTKILVYPNNIPYELENHFLRGYYDGDGSISFNGKRKSLEVSVVGTKNFIESLANILSIRLCLKSNNYYNHSNDLWCFRRSQLQGKKIGDYLYKGSTIRLERKFQNYKNFCNLKGDNFAI